MSATKYLIRQVVEAEQRLIEKQREVAEAEERRRVAAREARSAREALDAHWSGKLDAAREMAGIDTKATRPF